MLTRYADIDLVDLILLPSHASPPQTQTLRTLVVCFDVDVVFGSVALIFIDTLSSSDAKPTQIAQ